jgi:RNA polymerase sigma-70 factor (ECF subfamily)
MPSSVPEPDDPSQLDGQPRAIGDELLRHLDAAFNLARWLSGNDHDAQDIVQEAYLRAVRFRDQCRQESTRAWLLQIVRNTCHTWSSRTRTRDASIETLAEVQASEAASPQRVLERRQDASAVRRAIELLPGEFREAIVLREIEGMSYREIAQIAGVPVGTVMSRLSRGRERLKELLADYREEVRT